MHARHFLQHQRIRNGIESRPAPLFRHQHPAAAHLAEFLDRFGRKFFRLLPFLHERAHLRLHELADGIANQFLVVAKRKIHQSIVRGVRTMLTQPGGMQKARRLGGMTCHRMTWMRTPTFTFFQDLSAVYTGAFKASPSAKQARSPKDKPSGRVRATRSPTSLPCSEVKGTTSRTGLSAASHASPGRRPRPTSLPCTSARLTVLMAAALKSSGVNVSAPGSRLR